MIRALSIMLCLLCGPALSQAQSTAEAADNAAARLNAAADRLAAAQGGQERIAALTETVQAYEDGLTALRDGLRRGAIRQRVLEADLEARSSEISQLLGVLQEMGRAPAPLLLLHPSGPLGTARSGMMLSEVTPALHVRVEELRAKLTEMSEIQALQDNAAARLQAGLTGAQDARTDLAQAVSDRTDLPLRYIEDPIAAALLIASTQTLDAFAGGLAQIIDHELAISAPDATARKGTLTLPVQGEVIRRFNEADAAGVVRPGLIIAARPRALVTAPAAATIRFQGPLLDYGNVVILEPASGVLIVLAGLAQAFGTPGQVVPEGAPLGIMGGELPDANAILTETALGAGENRPETLYLEVREGQTPVDPAAWFTLAE
ncbi:MAG: peptidoglycan DD-metalloendopeptidase family protein [Rhodobacteraceae bacterium]|nr:peptidoglycan DD-metalloendopeptidase family protein [Paracoccaceae bacterium]